MDKKRLIVFGAALLLAIVLAIPAAIYGPRMLGLQEAAENSPDPDAAPAQVAEPATPANFTEFRHEELGIALSYPANWARLQHPEPQVVLVASGGPLATIQLRAVDIEVAVRPDQLETARELTDHIVAGNETAKLLIQPTQVERGGLHGYWYLYTFTEEDGEEGAHSHFFFFKDNILLSLVFETIPADKFGESAATFDQIINSLRVL